MLKIQNIVYLNCGDHLSVAYTYKTTSVAIISINPLTPVPAVTGHAKTHPQFPVPAVTGREKACEDNCLSTEENLVLLLFHCCLNQ